MQEGKKSLVRYAQNGTIVRPQLIIKMSKTAQEKSRLTKDRSPGFEADGYVLEAGFGPERERLLTSGLCGYTM